MSRLTSTRAAMLPATRASVAACVMCGTPPAAFRPRDDVLHRSCICAGKRRGYPRRASLPGARGCSPLGPPPPRHRWGRAGRGGVRLMGRSTTRRLHRRVSSGGGGSCATRCWTVAHHAPHPVRESRRACSRGMARQWQDCAPTPRIVACPAAIAPSLLRGPSAPDHMSIPLRGSRQ